MGLATGCLGHPLTARVLDLPGSPISQAVMRAAIQEVEGAVGEAILTTEDADMTISVEFASMSPQFAGDATVGDDCKVRISSYQDVDPSSPFTHAYFSKMLRLIFLHEIGHCFGLGHSPSYWDIMYWKLVPDRQDGAESFRRYVESLDSVRNQ